MVCVVDALVNEKGFFLNILCRTGPKCATAVQPIDILTFKSGPPSGEQTAMATLDGDEGELVDIGDLTTLIAYLYIPPNSEPAPCQ